MSLNKTLSISLLVLGAVLFAAGNYLSSQSIFGEMRIESIEENAGSGGRPTLGPMRHAMREQKAEATQNKLFQAGENFAKLAFAAKWLQILGKILFLGGLVMALICWFTRNKR